MSTSLFYSRIKKVISLCTAVCFLSTICFPYQASASEVTVDELLGKEPADIEAPQNIPLKGDSSSMMLMSSMAGDSNSGASPQTAVNHFQFDPTSGSGVISLPISTPPARRGLKPNITLTYSPRAGNGPYGVGWDISFGKIERSTKNGVPSYNDAEDTFVAVIDGMSMEPIKIADGKYRAKVEGAFYNFQYDGQYWTVRNGKGLTYYFGRDDLYGDESREGPSGKTFRWRLSKVMDALGNYYLIRYLEEDAFEIYWTGDPGTDTDGVDVASQNFFARVETILEDSERTDVVLTQRGEFEEKISKRIKEIHVYAVDALQRKYVFDYADSQRSGRSLLKVITEYGADGASTMPAIAFEYEETPIQYSLVGVEDDPVVGDNLWSFRFNGGYDRGPDCYGAVPAWTMVPFSAPIVAVSWNPSNNVGSWTQDGYGRKNLHGEKDVAYYFYTYLYVDQDTTIDLSHIANDWDAGYWVNGDQAAKVANLKMRLNLNSGYNLVEYTDYNQNQSFHSNLTTALSDKVLLMNSVQLVLPQLAGDFNGDGLADVATFHSASGRIQVELSTGAAFLPKEDWLENIAENTRTLIGDVNADGMTDVILFDYSNGNWNVALSDGTKFVDDGNWLTGFGAEQQVTLADVNGDGRADAVRVFEEGSAQKIQIAFNAGDAFQLDINKAQITTNLDANVFAADFNGDGLADFGSFDSNTGNWKIIRNKGGYTKSLEEWGNDVIEVVGYGQNQKMALSDFNGDGNTDIGYYHSLAGQIAYKPVYGASTVAEGFTVPLEFMLKGENLQLQSADFNGDGISDFIVFNQVGNIEFAYSDGKVGDLLTQIDNGMGGITTITYTPSIAFDNVYLPFIMPLVTSVNVSNSRGDDVTTRYEYEGGLWKPEDREFYGFQKVRAYDKLGRYTETEFRQNDIYDRGKVDNVVFYDRNGYPLSATRNLEWENYEPFESLPIKFSYPSIIHDIEFLDDGTYTTVDAQYTSKATPTGSGGLIYEPKATFDGLVHPGSTVPMNSNDKRWVDMWFNNNTSDDVWLLGISKRIFHYETDSGHLADKTYLYYDNDDSGNIAPTAGLLTKKVVFDVDNEGNDQTFLYSYDAYGNLESTTDPREKTSSVVYDSRYHTFPVSEINPLNQSVTKEYYGVDGVPLSNGGYSGLFGQLRSVTDVNGVTESYVYDTFGRLVKAIGPRDSLVLPSVTYDYIIKADHMIKVVHKRLDHGGARTIDSAEFVNGLGRTICVKTNSGQDGTYIVAGYKGYDDGDRFIREYNPFAVTTPLTTLDALPAGWVHGFYQYDDKNRLTEKINTDGNFTSFSYDLDASDGTHITTSIDENGHQKKSYTDVHGHVFKIEEYSGADGRSPFYPQESFQLYATTQYQYGLRGQLEKVIDNDGNETVIAYDGLGRKKSMTDLDMGFWQYGYDENGNMKWQIDAKGQRLDFTYDDLNRLENKTDGADIDVSYYYDLNPDQYGKGRLGAVEYGSTPENDNTHFFYDEFGRETQSLKVIDGIGYYVERNYDDLGNLKEVQYPDGNSVHYHYDDAGRLDAIANDPVMFEEVEPLSKAEDESPLWRAVKGFYNDWFEPYVLGISEAYAEEDRPASLISPAENSVITSSSVTFRFDRGNDNNSAVLFWKEEEGDALGIFWLSHTTEYVLDNIVLDGNPVHVMINSFLKSGGALTTYYVFQTAVNPQELPYCLPADINADGMVAAADLSAFLRNFGGTDCGDPSNLWCQFADIDRSGDVEASDLRIFLSSWGHSTGECVRPPTITNQAPQISDIANRTIFSDQPWEIDIEVTDTDQDALSFVSEQIVLPQGAELTTVSNEAGRLEAQITWEPQRSDIGDHDVVLAVSDGQEEVSNSVTIHVARGPISEDPKLYVSDIQYNVMGQIKKITYGTGTIKEYFYNDVTFRLERVYTINNQGIAIQDLSYAYDSVGNIISITDNINTATQTFEYDHLNRLIEASAPATYGTKTYVYDEIGNIKEKDGLIYNYGENGDGPHAVTSTDSGDVFRYDDNGNMVNNFYLHGQFIYGFDAENRLNSVHIFGLHPKDLEFRYDGDGGRTKKVAYGTVFGVDIDSMAYPELLQDGAGENDLVTHFIGSLYEVDNFHEVKHIYMGSERILSVHDGEEQYIHGDHLGSANVVEDQHGDLVQINEYQPFGEFSREEKYTVDGQESDLYFTQQILDDETGLYYYGARYYDPALGRFISADSVVPSATNPQALNRYSYVYNSPLCYTDPSGNFGFLAAAIVGAIIGGVSAGIQSDWNMEAVGWGALAGGLSGAMLSPATTASSLQITAFKNTSMFLVKGSAALSLGSQVAGAAGWSDGAQVMGQASKYMGLAFAGLHVATGIANWIHDPRFQTVRNGGGGLQSGDHVHVNGILTPLEETNGFASNAIDEAFNVVGADALAYNPTSSPIADLVEATLGKLTTTSSVQRQLGASLTGLHDIALSGFSQGGIIAANTTLHLGLRGQRNIVSSLHVQSTQISQVRAAISGAIGGGLTWQKTVTYGVASPLDFSNALGPNIGPNFFGGVLGLGALPIGIANHRWR